MPYKYYLNVSTENIPPILNLRREDLISLRYRKGGDFATDVSVSLETVSDYETMRKGTLIIPGRRNAFNKFRRMAVSAFAIKLKLGSKRAKTLRVKLSTC